MARGAAEPLPDLHNIEALVEGEGQITLGAIHPIPCVAIANDGHDSLALKISPAPRRCWGGAYDPADV